MKFVPSRKLRHSLLSVQRVTYGVWPTPPQQRYAEHTFVRALQSETKDIAGNAMRSRARGKSLCRMLSVDRRGRTVCCGTCDRAVKAQLWEGESCAVVVHNDRYREEEERERQGLLRALFEEKVRIAIDAL